MAERDEHPGHATSHPTVEIGDRRTSQRTCDLRAFRKPPSEIEGCEWRDVHERHGQPASRQGGDADDDDHHDAHARRHQRQDAGDDPEAITPIDPTVMVDEDQLRQSEYQ